MKQKPYSSPLWAHANLIRELRLKRQSWQAIVDVLKAEHGHTNQLPKRPGVFQALGQAQGVAVGLGDRAEAERQPAKLNASPG
jgi:hypothetical protein